MMIDRDERRGEEVAEQRIGRDALEMVGGEGRGREARDERRDGHAQHGSPTEPQEPEARQHVIVGQAAPRGARARPPSRDQRGDRREGHLEARLDDALRLEREHDEGGDGEVAHRDRRPVDAGSRRR